MPRGFVLSLHRFLAEADRSFLVAAVRFRSTPVCNGAVRVESRSLAERTLGFEIPEAMQLADSLVDELFDVLDFGSHREIDLPRAAHQVGLLARSLVEDLTVVGMPGRWSFRLTRFRFVGFHISRFLFGSHLDRGCGFLSQDCRSGEDRSSKNSGEQRKRVSRHTEGEHGQNPEWKLVRPRGAEFSAERERTILPGNRIGFQATCSTGCEIARDWRQPGRRLFSFPRMNRFCEGRLQTEVPPRSAPRQSRPTGKRRRLRLPRGLQRKSAKSQ